MVLVSKWMRERDVQGGDESLRFLFTRFFLDVSQHQ
jgi:hypothetical protein